MHIPGFGLGISCKGLRTTTITENTRVIVVSGISRLRQFHITTPIIYFSKTSFFGLNSEMKIIYFTHIYLTYQKLNGMNLSILVTSLFINS